MSSLCSSGLYSLGHQSGCSTLPLPSLPMDLSNTTTRQRSSPQAAGLSTLSRRDGDASARQGSRDSSQDSLSLVGPSCPVTPSKHTTDNCRLRHYLARLPRKTLCYSKSKTMLEVSLKLLIHKLNNP